MKIVRSRRVLAVVTVIAGSVLALAAMAWACVGVASLVVGSPTVEPGGTLSVTGRSFARGVPVEIRLDSATGPVLLTVPGPDSTMNSSFTVSVPIPADISRGRHVLLAFQDHHDMNVGAPARAVFYAGTAPSPAPSPQPRPAAVEVQTGPSVAALVLIGLGVAAAGLLAAAVWSGLSGRGGPRAGAGATGA